MINISQFYQILKNKVFFYVFSRYITYFIQFLTALLIAGKLGPYYLGVWGFILLILNYFQQFHFGIANSLNVLLVHHNGEKKKSDSYIANSIMLTTILCVFVGLIYINYLLFGDNLSSKFPINNYSLGIAFIAIMQYYNMIFINIFRVKNLINQVTFSQSIVVFLNFICVFFFTRHSLVTALLFGYLIGNFLNIILAIHSKIIPANILSFINLDTQQTILKKGLYLFLYNSCFYFIVISIRSIVSCYYSVDEFGLFTFSFTLANAIMLLLDAIAFIIFPKLIDKLSTNNINELKKYLSTIQITYVTAAHFLIYIALCLFPIILKFFPKYSSSILSLNLISLSVLMNSSSFGYTTLLIAKNRERIAAIISGLALLLNVAIGLIIAIVLKWGYSFVIISTMLTYLIFSLLAMNACRNIGLSYNLKTAFHSIFPIRLLVPFIVALVISLLQMVSYIITIPLLLFLILNYRTLVKLKAIIAKLMINSSILNL